MLIEECSKVVRPLKDVSLAFFYCREKDGQRNTFASVAKAILVQLLRQNLTLLPYLYDECLKIAKPTLSSSKDCEKLLSTAFHIVPQTFFIIDGIDECEQKERADMLKFFKSVINKNSNSPGKIRGIFISQDLNDIRSILQGTHIIRLGKAHSEVDIWNYAVAWAYKIQKQRRFQLMPDNARDHIVKLVCEGAEGMFLFARLVLQNLFDQESLEHVYKEMHPDTFPDGFDRA